MWSLTSANVRGGTVLRRLRALALIILCQVILPAHGQESAPVTASLPALPVTEPAPSIAVPPASLLVAIDDALVRKWESFYAARPDYWQRINERGRRYLHFIICEIERRGMPLEIALLPVIESAYNPEALSRARALGIWQFVPETGKL